MALTTGNLLFDAQINNEKRSNRIFKDLSLNFNQNPVTKDITKSGIYIGNPAKLYKSLP